MERYQPSRGFQHTAHGCFDILQTDRTDFALRLGQNHIGSQLAEPPGIHIVQRQPLVRRRFHALVNFAAGPRDIDPRARALGQPQD